MIGPLSVQPSHQHDTGMLPAPLTARVDVTEQSSLDLAGAASTRAAGVASQTNKDLIHAHPMPPVLSPHRRHAKTPRALARLCRWLARHLSRLRSKVERACGWPETLRKLVIRYERLPEMRTGCRL